MKLYLFSDYTGMFDGIVNKGNLIVSGLTEGTITFGDKTYPFTEGSVKIPQLFGDYIKVTVSGRVNGFHKHWDCGTLNYRSNMYYPDEVSGRQSLLEAKIELDKLKTELHTLKRSLADLTGSMRQKFVIGGR